MLEINLTLSLVDTVNEVNINERLGVVLPVQDPGKVMDLCERFFATHMDNLLVPTMSQYDAAIAKLAAERAAAAQRVLEDEQHREQQPDTPQEVKTND